jgi:riboflavin synthase
MFTGLIQKIGVVKRVSRGAGLVLEVGFEPWARPLDLGESVALNGVCLTVARCSENRFTADVLRETEERTSLGSLVPGDKVNLERALRAGDAMGGHIVQGHVDCRGKVVGKERRGRDFRLKVRCTRVLAAQSVVKGSITIDGTSLTITDIGSDWIAVDLIPTTLRDTTLGNLRLGSEVNLEGDILGKYVSKALKPAGITQETLLKAGFLQN